MNVIERFELIEGDTFVSNYGRVVNADGPHNGKKVFKVRYELKTSIIDPYVYVWVKKNRYQLHKLVAQYFMGWSGEGRVNHLDGESRNNFVGNLSVSSSKQKPRVWEIPEYHNGRVYKVENNRIFRSKSYVKQNKMYNGYKGFYKVSDQGNVKNCYEKPVAVSVNADGVCSVMLTAFKTSRRVSLHYLVWGAFNEFLNTSDKVRHIDGDKTNNRLSNLSRSTGRKIRLSMKENWVDIDGTDLKVSTFGRVKSIKILKPKFNSTGCQFYMIDGKVSYIHDILARVFLGWDGVDGYAGYRDRNTSNTDLSNIVIKDYMLKYKKIMD